MQHEWHNGDIFHNYDKKKLNTALKAALSWKYGG